ncbi:LPXTG cell wall anchor domain-containing protein [Micromonospora mirobrigensis]|uniref:LPXTG-motif cell wall anchor domain-containing protein n=1 Tax=Micromonospora mirobrigensis TaxID=262898 RepID=A0A1C5A4R6_9ACTN|nr:LPXTG cell wall anchor domain-containing protein [Micromonospora mirobrigensis]SCF40188.1 LPXTG-motif cell wall anchor domain-containing protein [Micromonospora mirobrigensis]
MFRTLITGSVAAAAAAAAATLALPLAATAAPATPTAAPTASPSATSTPTAPASTKATPTTAADTGRIEAMVDLVNLHGDPWRPVADLTVNLRNESAKPEKAYFMLEVPANLGIDYRYDDCKQQPGGGTRKAICGWAQLGAHDSGIFRLGLVSLAKKPIFGQTDWGSVTGRTASGVSGQKRDFKIVWPDRTSLRLRASAKYDPDASTTVTATVTNTGSFAISGYSLMLRTDAKRLTPACREPSRGHNTCEIERKVRLAPGATDTVKLRLVGLPNRDTLHLTLAPEQRYTNRDTVVVLRLGVAGDESRPAEPTPSRSTAPGQAAGDNSGSGSGAELPRTGATVGTYAMAGGGLVTVGGALLLLRRRRHRFTA